MMLGLIAAELALGVVVGLWFVLAYRRLPWRHTPAGRHVMAVAVVMVADMAGLLLVAVGVRPPLWAFALVYGLADVVIVHRLILLYQARRAGHSSR